jgi:cytochrome c oxidase subunit 3
LSSIHDHRYRVAVWVVIASEALLFAGLFALYASYRTEYPDAFRAGVTLDLQWVGGVNTFLLLTSSFLMSWAVQRVRRARGGAGWALLGVLVLGGAFLALKLVEWAHHVRDGLLPGTLYAGPPHGLGTGMFFTLYYAMTGLHALHVVVGLALVAWVGMLVRIRRETAGHALALELVTVYWHFVDVVWMFLWPLFYLMHNP